MTTFTSDTGTQIVLNSPAGGAGTVDVTVVTPGGTSATSTADQFSYLAAPTVTNVLVSSTDWSSTFLSSLASLGSQNAGGYSIPVGSGAQLATLPWNNINQIEVVFSENVTVNQADLASIRCQYRGVQRQRRHVQLQSQHVHGYLDLAAVDRARQAHAGPECRREQPD